MADDKKEAPSGQENLKLLQRIPQDRQKERTQRSLSLGLEAAPSIRDRNISLFARETGPPFAGIRTFMNMPYCEDVKQVSRYEAAFVGVPFDSGTTYRPGTRFGPAGVRRASAHYDGYSVSAAVDLHEELNLCDIGDVYTIPGNIEKTFDQVTRAVSHIVASGVFPIICGGDHSLGFPNVRGVASHIQGNLGIIHFDSHLDCDESQMDERMHGTPWYYAVREPTPDAHRHHNHMHEVGLPNCHSRNLVQVGIGGWAGMRGAAAVARRRNANVITIADIRRLGTVRAAEMALELAWNGCSAVYLSFDIDSIDPGFAPGTGTPEPGALLSHEALEMVQIVASKGLCGMDVVEISPPYDDHDKTSLLGCRVILDALAAMVTAGKLGHRQEVMQP
jgi:agmatinase